MSLLNRFRTEGGFQQLLFSLETCEPKKQEQLLALVAMEDPGWAHLLKVKCLTMNRVFSWPRETLMEITAALPEPILATVYQMAEQAGKADKWIEAIPSMKAKEIRELSSRQLFSPTEQVAAQIKVFQIIRELEAKGTLRFSTFDPLLEIDRRLAA